MSDSTSLPKGYQLHNYRIEQILGEGGFGITYKAVDLNLNRLVAIKEYMPLGIAVRSNTGDIEPISAEYEETYQNGLMSYVREAQALALFEHDNIVKVKAFLRHHKTAYIIMEYVDGMTFSDWLIQHPEPSEAELIGIVSPILAGLHELHKVDLLHRDIKPSNIYICNNHRPLLLDFGAVRNSTSPDSHEDLSVISLTEGYAPPEQYGESGQGPWTDVYAVGACLHLAVTGKKVTNAMERHTQVLNGDPDPQPGLKNTALRNDYSSHFLDAIEQAISLNPEDRISDALSLKNSLQNIKTPQITDNGKNRMDPADTGQLSENESGELKSVNTDSSIFPAGSDPSSNDPTIARAPIVDFETPVQSPIPDNDQPEQSSHEANSGISGSGKSKLLLRAGAVAGLIALAWIVKMLLIKEQDPDSLVVEAKSQIDQKIELIEVMELPKTGDYKDAMRNRQLAMDIESKKVDGSVKDIRDNFLSADTLFEAHILSTAPVQNAELLKTVNSIVEQVKQLGVEGISSLDLSRFAKEATDIESLKSNYRELLTIANDLEDGVRKNVRSYKIGSSAEDIEEALELCKQYANDCAREWYEDEVASLVTLSPFDIDKSEVTVGEFSRYAEANGIVTSAQAKGFSYAVDPSKDFAVSRSDGIYWKNAYGDGSQTNNLPVVHVSRADAQDYCNSVSKRLPTEAEWEYIARGSNRFKYPWGDVWDPERVNWGGVTGLMKRVNSFQANDRGYFDLAGSVTEWTSTESNEENTGILKGGSRFDKNVANFRLPVKRLESIDYTGEDVGFRCASTLGEWPGIY